MVGEIGVYGGDYFCGVDACDGTEEVDAGFERASEETGAG